MWTKIKKEVLIMNKQAILTLLLLLGLVLVGCTKLPPDDEGDRVELKVIYAPSNAMATLTYNTGTPITLPNGESYSNGDLKPVWRYITKELNINLKDITNQSQTGTQMMEIAASRKFQTADIFGGDVAEQIMSNGAQGYFINLNDHKDKLPDFYKFLESEPRIKSFLTAYDGGIYHIPYIAEQGEFSRVFYGRYVWVEHLLDNNNIYQQIKNENRTLNVNYQGYWKDSKKRHSTNVIELQNSKNVNGKLNAEGAYTALIEYIDSTYPELNKRSDLFLGVNAKYDIDELIALFRLIKLSPKILSKQSTNQELENVQIVPYFFRSKNQREAIFSLVNYFGGTRTYGSNTFANKFYIDENNELQFSFIQDEFFEGVKHLQDIFSEGLIHSDWDDQGNSANYRTLLYGSDLEVDKNGQSTVKELGFMTCDFFASTASSSPTGSVKAFLPPLTTLPGGGDEFVHYVEIPRTIMNNAWGIAKHVTGEKLDAALKLLNYTFTKHGSFVQNFGIPGVTADFDNLWLTPRGEMVPTINQWLVDTANTMGAGDIPEFSRSFLGIRVPIVYAANIGYELQYMVPEALEGYNLYVDANVKTLDYNSSNNYLLLAPPVFSLNMQDRRQLNTISVGDQQIDMLYNYIKSIENHKTLDYIKQSFYDDGIDVYLDVYRRAYNRSKIEEGK